MEHYIGSSMTSARVTAGKMVADQAVYAPRSILTYFAYTHTMPQKNDCLSTTTN